MATIDDVELSFDGAMTVLTGETGAGKSILVGALGLALGDRADSGVVRADAKRAEITAVFDLSQLADVNAWLETHELDADGDCVLRRVVAREGRSRAWINGTSVPLSLLRQLGAQLADIHGQHEHQSLLRGSVQRGIVDSLGNNGKALDATAAAFSDWREACDALEQLTGSIADREARMDFLSFQVREFDALGLENGELEALEQEQQRSSHQERLHLGAQEALELTMEREHDDALTLIGRAEKALDGLHDIDTGLAEPRELIASAGIQLTEAGTQLRQYLDTLEVDPERGAWVENRIGSAHALARKHRIDPGELTACADRLRDELATLQDAEQNVARLQTRIDEARSRYEEKAAALTRRRRRAAKALTADVTAAIQELGLAGGRFEAKVQRPDSIKPSRDGQDRVEFLVSANPGQPPGPLGKVASGGELSRISLGIEVVAARAIPVPCMVFDEVDTGVGGGVAEIVGHRLRALGASRQVLCVTHLPQVASQANTHVRVAKLTDGKTTRTTLSTLTDDERVEEVARMLGGVKITKATREHAREMMAVSGDG